MDFDFETSYQKQFTQSILQSVIIPMAAQAGQFDIILKLMKELPVTNSMKEQLEELSSDMKERADDNNKVQNSKDSMSKEALLNNTSGNGGTEKTSAKKNKK